MDSAFVIENVHIFDGEKMSPATGLLIKDGLIAEKSADSEGVPIVDGRGGTLLPGLIDAHIHLGDPKRRARMAAWGVSTAFDMGGKNVTESRQWNGNPGQAQVTVHTGLAIAPPRSTHSRLLRVPAADGPDQAREMALARIKLGVDYLKVIVDSRGLRGTMKLIGEDVLRAYVQTGHERGFKVIAHTTSMPGLEMAVRCGVDIFTHLPGEETISPELAALMAERGMWSVPTLIVLKTLSGDNYSPAGASIAVLRRAGVPIMAGTDSNPAPVKKLNVPHGRAMHQEIDLLARAGMDNQEILHAATGLTADLFGQKDRGKIEAGRRADLLLVDGDPLRDLSSVHKIEKVWIAGREVRNVAVGQKVWS